MDINTTKQRIGLFFDTETTGIPEWKLPSDAPEQPHIVQLAAELVDLDTREVLDSMDVIVKPEGWIITDELAALHGTTQARALEVGILEDEAIDMLLKLRDRATIRIAHNRTFDDRIVRIALKRYHDMAILETKPSDLWKEGEGFCTCQSAKKALGLKKLPTLTEAYDALIGGEFDGVHTALGDTRACKAVYFALMDRATALTAEMGVA